LATAVSDRVCGSPHALTSLSTTVFRPALLRKRSMSATRALYAPPAQGSSSFDAAFGSGADRMSARHRFRPSAKTGMIARVAASYSNFWLAASLLSGPWHGHRSMSGPSPPFRSKHVPRFSQWFRAVDGSTREIVAFAALYANTAAVGPAHAPAPTGSQLIEFTHRPPPTFRIVDASPDTNVAPSHCWYLRRRRRYERTRGGEAKTRAKGAGPTRRTSSP